MNRLLLATRNAHKKSELSKLLTGVPIGVFAGLTETVEDQLTLEGNAAKKARECAAASGQWSLADDTGLEVRALDGAPGVYSARYAGLGCTYADNNRKLLAALAGKKDRSAVFRTVMALSSPGGEVTLEQGALEGAILEAPRGENGFGYDELFFLPAVGKSLAELEPEEKNLLSHRGKALRAIVPQIRRAFGLVVSLFLIWTFTVPAQAGRTEPGQETLWDEIMASQAHRQLRIGARYLDEKKYASALKELQRAVMANPKDPAAQTMLGVAYYWNGEIDRSVECYQRSLELEPQDAQPRMLLGISLAYKGQLPEALLEFQKAAQLDPSRPDIQMNLGSIEDSLNRTLDALEHFRKAAQLAPREPLYHYQLGMLYRKLGRDQEAAESLRAALKYFPEFEDALLELGAVDERRGDPKAAMRSFKKATDLKSRDAVARFRLARLYLSGQEPRKARAVLAEAFHLTPEAGGSGLQLSVSYAGGKKEMPASEPAPKAEPDANDPLSLFQRNLDRIPLDQNALMQVDVMFAPKPKLVKQSGPEVSSLSKALKREIGERPQIKAVRREYRIASGGAPEREREIARVLDDLRAVMKEAPSDADVRLGMNLSFTKPTQTSVGRVDAQSPPKVSFEPRQVGNDLGLWIIGTGWMSLVEEVLPEPGDAPSHPDTSDWWVATGLGFATIGDGQRALGAFERATDLDAASEAAWLGRGVALVMTGDEKGAEAALRRVLQVNPQDRTASEGLKWLQRPSASKAAGKGSPR